MRKQTIAILLLVTMIIGVTPNGISAEAKNLPNVESDNEEHSDIGTIATGNNLTIDALLKQYKFTARQGHGFAAEQGNNLIDRLSGLNAEVVGGDNVKNGADRKLIGRDGTKIWIQDKYYRTASESVNACFEGDVFRYVDADGVPMQIEVPKDQVEGAVQLMRKKIEDGKLKSVGITDPDDAMNIIRPGHLTYQQAVNLAKAGTIESLTYDAANGTISAACSFGISSVITYAVLRLNGDTPKEALRVAAVEGLKTGGVVFGTAIIAGQLTKTNIMKTFVPASEALVKTFGDDFASAVMASVGEQVTGMTDDVLRTKAARVLWNQALMGGISIVILSVDDVVEIIRGRISVKQLTKNLAAATAGVVGGYAGSVIGGAAGTAIAPGIGTTVGQIVGGVLIGGVVEFGTDKLLDIFVEDDAEKMLEVIEDSFAALAEEYMLNEEEAKRVVETLQTKLTGKNLKNMFASNDWSKYAQGMIRPLMEQVVSCRSVIITPTEAEMRTELKKNLEGIVYVH